MIFKITKRDEKIMDIIFLPLNIYKTYTDENQHSIFFAHCNNFR